jgi:Uma2 family endonuclease
MNAILEVSSIRERVSRVTVEEYHRLPELNAHGRPTELIRGIVVEKMSKFPLHGTIASRLFQLLLPVVPPDFCARQEQPLTLHDSEPEPDVSVLEGSLGDYLSAHPTTARLVVEVAVTTYAEDQQKAFLYAEAAVAEYWIVLPSARTVEVHRRPEAGRYCEMRVVHADDELACESVPGLRIVLGELFAGLDRGTARP